MKMMFSKAAIFTAIAGLSSLALAADNGQTKVHVVLVSDSQGSLKFYPEELTAQAGEVVQFQFNPKNHSVAQSSFEDPCMEISKSSSGNGTNGFFSGFMPVSDNAQVIPTFTVPIVDNKPIWFYCATGKHCQNGMVGVINAPQGKPDRTLSKYKEAAAKANSSPPGSKFGGNNGTTTPSSTGGSAGTPTSTGSQSTGTGSNSTGSASSLSATFSVLFGAIVAALFLS